MELQFVLLTRSYKYGGYCVAGFHPGTGRFLRLVASEDPLKSEIPKEIFRDFDYLDILKVEVVCHAPCGCQMENYLLDMHVPPVLIGKFPFVKLLETPFLSTERHVFGNEHSALSAREIADMSRSLTLIKADRVHLAYYRDEKGKMRFPCKFLYRGAAHAEIAVTDPVYRQDALAGEEIPHALIAVSLPAVPYTDGSYYKFAAKIIPVSEKISARLDALLSSAEEGAPAAREEVQNVDVRAFLIALADGKDPFTEEEREIPAEYAKMFRLAAESIRRAPPRAAAGERPVWKHWSPEEEANLVREYRSGLSVRKIAAMHDRTEGGIRSRLSKLGLLEE